MTFPFCLLLCVLYTAIFSCLALSAPLPPPSPCLVLRLADFLAGHLHGVGDCANSLCAVGVGAGPRAGSIQGAGTGQGGCPGASKPGHTRRGHWGEGDGSIIICITKEERKEKRKKSCMIS